MLNFIYFSDNGECLFVGSSSGISVIGWEPDRELDHIKSTWSSLADMKVVNNKLVSESTHSLSEAPFQISLSFLTKIISILVRIF